MITKILMPQVGQDLETGRIVRWIKKEGDAVKKGDVVCEVETEKAVVEVPAPADGFLVKILHPDNAEVKILAEIGFIGAERGALPVEEKADESDKVRLSQAETARQTAESAPAGKQERRRISPKAKKIAMENNIPVEKIHGSGPRGRIVSKDVLDFIRNRTAPGSTVSSGSPQPAAGIIPLNKIQKATARRLQHSKQTIPHFYLTVSVNMTPLLNRQAKLNEKFDLSEGETISINDFIVRACALALQEFPMLRSTFSEEGLQVSDTIDIGVAVALENSLVVAVIEDCAQLNLQDLSAHIRQAVEAARNGRQLMTRPARFTVSNLGMYQVEEFAAIINPPEVGILAVGTIRKELVVQKDSSVCIQDLMKLTLSVDHRAVDGVQAAKFLNRIKQILEDSRNF